jgi:hypothetical protein
MARAYTLATAALTLRVQAKWLDNTLSHIRVPGVKQERQGVARRITIDGLLILSIAALLIHELSMPLAPAIRIAAGLSRNGGEHTTREGVWIRLNLERVRSMLLERLENAVEIAPLPRRGRPPKNKTGRLD